MPSGYQNRILPAYWTSPDVAWTGVKWTAASITQCRMVPSAGMLADAAEGLSEIRMFIKINGVKLIWLYDGTTLLTQFFASGLANERLAIRSPFGVTTSFRMVFDAATGIDILEIGVGLIGNH